MVGAALRDWYRGRRVLVTGHTGFKGSWLVAWLRDAGAEVTGLALAPEEGRPSLFDIARIAEGVTSVIGDVRNRSIVGETLRRSQPEVVMHLAAQSLVRRSYAMPVDTFDTNVVGTAQLLDAVRGVESVRGVVVVTSDKCYENQGLERGYREDDPMGGHDPYSASKGCQELVTAAFRRSYFNAGQVSIASARAGNVIGGGDWSEDRLIADLMIAAAEGRSAAIRNPDSVRPWQHVLEPLRGYLMLGRALVEEGQSFAEGWNFGPSLVDAVSVRQLVSRMTSAWPNIKAEIAPEANAPHEARLLRLDNTKARERLGWQPSLTLDDTVNFTVEWYRAVHERPSCAAAMMQQQINDYERRAAGAGTTQ
ncbi:CDP-glucose 4,6-dehydratase [soil metagenome]